MTGFASYLNLMLFHWLGRISADQLIKKRASIQQKSIIDY